MAPHNIDFALLYHTYIACGYPFLHFVKEIAKRGAGVVYVKILLGVKIPHGFLKHSIKTPTKYYIILSRKKNMIHTSGGNGYEQ